MKRPPAFPALFITLLLGAPLLPACTTSGCGAAMNDAPGVAEGTDDQTTELTAVKSLIGAYQASSGTEALRGLLLAKRGDGTQVFAAERKLAACAQPQHLAGTFRVSATSSSLTLTPESGASLRYRYEKTATGLTLYDGATVVGRLGTVATYCTRSTDCELQSYIHPACAGRAVCTSEQRCGYSCAGLARGYGDVCGGIAGLQCESGLSCGIEDDRGCAVTKPFPDQSGVCRSAGCTGYRCATGESCRLQEGAPTCQPDKTDLCARVRCRGEQPHCVEAQGESACLAVDACHRDSECPTGQRCQPAITCTREPCFAPLVCK